MGINRLTHPRARRVVKHPGRNLEPTARIGAAQVAAKNNAVRLADRFVNADAKTKPRMPSVQDFAKLGSVGVLKIYCTTTATHQALGSRTPMAAWREGIGGGFLDTAVDMTLRLDNARALPTCPQPQQQQQIAA